MAPAEGAESGKEEEQELVKEVHRDPQSAGVTARAVAAAAVVVWVLVVWVVAVVAVVMRVLAVPAGVV